MTGDGTPDAASVVREVREVLAGAGLCARCVHVLVRPTNKGTVYLRCARAATDPAFPRYPRLPVLACPGVEPGGDLDT